MERKIILKTLVGSHNYNLNDNNSDRDYKIFVAPTFDDLYSGHIHTKSHVGESEDYTIHDIRKIPQLFWKSNINFIELLYSKKIDYNASIFPEIDAMFKLRDKLVKMNLPYLYNACFGNAHNKYKNLEKGTSGTQHLIEKFGYDTKEALHCYRMFDFLQRFSKTNFNNFQQAVSYEGQEREFMFGIKHGNYTLIQFKEMVMRLKTEVETNIKPHYSEQKPQHEFLDELNYLIKDLVRKNI